MIINNIEIKAKVDSYNRIKKIIEGLDYEYLGEDHQIDTYFKTNSGRLKLRSGNIENSLIYYDRPNSIGPKKSNGIIQKLNKDNNIKSILQKTNNIEVIVDKRRHIYFVNNVKLHLDVVNNLGVFIEIEAIDKNNSYSDKELLEQCETFLSLFDIKKNNLINCSYSDLILIKNNDSLLNSDFIEKVIKKVPQINLTSFNCDHICFRVNTLNRYEIFKSYFKINNEFLRESKVNGREISIFKLKEPLVYKNLKVNILELPAPKEGSTYQEGFEHLEFVIKETFSEFEKKYLDIQFDRSAIDKENNPELRLKISETMSVKFHHRSLEKTIINEMALT